MLDYAPHEKYPFSISLKFDEPKRMTLLYIGFEELGRLVFDPETGSMENARWSVDAAISRFSFRDEEDALMFILKNF